MISIVASFLLFSFGILPGLSLSLICRHVTYSFQGSIKAQNSTTTAKIVNCFYSHKLYMKFITTQIYIPLLLYFFRNKKYIFIPKITPLIFNWCVRGVYDTNFGAGVFLESMWSIIIQCQVIDEVDTIELDEYPPYKYPCIAYMK